MREKYFYILKRIYLGFRKHLLHALAALFARKNLPYLGSGQDIKKILFIRIDRIGDIVLSTPALKAVKEAYPHSKITVLASPSNSPLVFNNPNIDYIVVYDRRGRLIDRIRVIQKLRESGFDLAIDPYADYELKTALIAFFSGAKRRIGYASYGREVFFNLPAPEIRSNRHFVDLTLDVLKPVGIVANDKPPEIFLTDDEKKWAGDWLNKNGLGSNPVIGIHPGAYYETQRWLPERFAELIELLQKDKKLDVVIFGGPDDEHLVNRICSILHGEVTIHIAHDLRKLAALIPCCHVFVCNNSGPLHMAVALGTPTISFMGPTIKERWIPIGNIHTVLRRDKLPCIGCNLGHCKIKTHDCMRLITAPMVIKAIENIL
ncbi:MAG: glycosyltransferase family 9 protein [Deltaproteobacteria bacterium]|nr:glycosyltransferase family 9 protein [Deltaproteobacteria bacterium]